MRCRGLRSRPLCVFLVEVAGALRRRIIDVVVVVVRDEVEHLRQTQSGPCGLLAGHVEACKVTENNLSSCNTIRNNFVL